MPHSNNTPSQHQALQVRDYEVLSQEGGDLALTFNAGVLAHTPQALQIHEGDLHLLARQDGAGDALRLIGWIEVPASAVLAKALSAEGLLVVELSTLGVHSAQTLYANLDASEVKNDL